jgi:hypothetical protein
MNYGLKANQLRIQMQRRGLLNSSISLVGKGANEPAPARPCHGYALSDRAGRSTGSLRPSGEIRRDGVKLGSIVSADIAFTNNLDKIETIQPDGEIEGADGGTAMASW